MAGVHKLADQGGHDQRHRQRLEALHLHCCSYYRGEALQAGVRMKTRVTKYSQYHIPMMQHIDIEHPSGKI